MHLVHSAPIRIVPFTPRPVPARVVEALLRVERTVPRITLVRLNACTLERSDR